MIAEHIGEFAYAIRSPVYFLVENVEVLYLLTLSCRCF